MAYPIGEITRIEDLRASHDRRNGRGARPNVYKRSLEARETTNAYLAEVERKAAGVDEPVPPAIKRRVWHLAVGVLLAVGLLVAAWVL